MLRKSKDYDIVVFYGLSVFGNRLYTFLKSYRLYILIIFNEIHLTKTTVFLSAEYLAAAD